MLFLFFFSFQDLNSTSKNRPDRKRLWFSQGTWRRTKRIYIYIFFFEKINLLGSLFLFSSLESQLLKIKSASKLQRQGKVRVTPLGGDNGVSQILRPSKLKPRNTEGSRTIKQERRRKLRRAQRTQLPHLKCRSFSSFIYT